jgi:hypothetical protein
VEVEDDVGSANARANLRREGRLGRGNPQTQGRHKGEDRAREACAQGGVEGEGVEEGELLGLREAAHGGAAD